MDKQPGQGRRATDLSRHMGVLALALLAGAMAGCGGGGEGSDDSFFGITGPRANGSSPGDSAYTVCVNGTGLVDPNSAEGQKMALRLAARYQVKGGAAYSGTGKSCNTYFTNPAVVLTTLDYGAIVLDEVVLPTPTPAQTKETTPPAQDTVLLPVTPRTCGESEGPGFNGLRLVGPSRHDGLTTVPKSADTFNFDPGLVVYSNAAVSSSALTGSLRVVLWAASGAYTGSAVPAVAIHRAALEVGNDLAQLRNGFQVDPPMAAVSGTTPERGSYCLVVTLEQYSDSCTTADKYCIVDWIQYPNAVQFQ